MMPHEDGTNTIVSLIPLRGRTNKWECFNSRSSFTAASGRPSLSLRFFIDHRRLEFFWFWAQTISFLFWPVKAILYGTVELLTRNTPGQGNRLTLLAAETMTCSSSSSWPLFELIPTEMSFVDQELSNGVFISTVRPSQQKLVTRLTKRTIQRDQA